MITQFIRLRGTDADITATLDRLYVDGWRVVSHAQDAAQGRGGELVSVRGSVDQHFGQPFYSFVLERSHE